MMKRLSVILLAGLCATAVSQAQELPSGQKPDGLETTPQTPWYDTIDSLSYHQWLNSKPMSGEIDLTRDFDRMKPADQKKAEALQVMQERANKSIVMIPKAVGYRDPNQDVGVWRWTVGNTAPHNWSSFLDIFLDARTIKFPVPQGARPDNRPLQVRRLEKVRQR